MADENKENENKFDANKFKEEMMNEQKAMNEALMNELISKVNNTIEEKITTIKGEDEKAIKKQNNKLENELEVLGIDEDQAAAIVSLVKKHSKNIDGEDLEKSILEKVSKKTEIKDKQKELNAQTAARYPDVVNPTSRLWKEAQKIYNSFDENMKNSYMATSLAVESAANKLGIQPIDISNIRAGQAQNETHGGGGGKNTEKKITQKDFDFAKSFGVDPKVFEKHLKYKMQNVEK